MKAITAGNYIVRPFVTHKTQTYGYAFLSGGNPAQVSIDLAVVPPTASSWQFYSANDPINPSGIFQRPLYESVKHLFYETSTVDRGFQPTGSALYVVSLAQNSYGEQIRPGTFSLTEGTSIGSIVDDGEGGLIYTGSVSASVLSYHAGDSISSLNGTFSRASTATYVDVNGMVQTASVGVVRDSHYANGTRTVLLENAATNLILWARTLTNATWTKGGVASVATTNGADGTVNSASRITVGAAPDTITQLVSGLTNGERFEPSLFIKPVDTTGTLTVYNPQDAASGQWNINLSLLPTGSYTHLTRSHVAVSVVAEFVAVSSACGIGFYADATHVVDVDMCQLETGSVSTAPIITTNATATRQADLLSFPLIGDSSKMTVVVTSIPTGSTVSLTGTDLVFSTGSYEAVAVDRPASTLRVGNIFYSNGVAVINDTASQYGLSDIGLNLSTGSALTIEFDATHTIYEHHIICTMDSGELNYSINPSVKNTALDGGKVINHMATGSLQPYMTQIGLYNDDGELLAIGKFPRPLKRAVGSQQSVIIRFDA